MMQAMMREIHFNSEFIRVFQVVPLQAYCPILVLY